MERLISLVIGYLFGLIQTSYFLGRKHHIDIRKVGSGNAGMTNTMRTLGTKAGLLVLLVDMMKCVLAVAVVKVLFRSSAGDILPLLGMYAAVGCILGHNYPFYLNFKGGKGVASSAGMILAIDWRLFVVAMTLFFLLFFTTHYVSFAALCAYVLAFITLVILGVMGEFHMTAACTIEMCALMGLLTLQVFFRHRENIKRLLAGTERKTYLTKKSES